LLGKKTRTLLSISSPAVADVRPHLPPELLNGSGTIGSQLVEFLTAKNGFYAFENALHVLPASGSTATTDLERWNDVGLWKGLYSDPRSDFTFFAEDVFANQFGFSQGVIYRFEPETGEVLQMAGDLEEWAEKVINDCNVETGYPLAKRWRELHGPLPAGMRLFPKTPFVLGGDYDIDNVFALETIEGLSYLADICRQIEALPDGSQVRLRTF
jgi:hypothetical protein